MGFGKKIGKKIFTIEKPIWLILAVISPLVVFAASATPDYYERRPSDVGIGIPAPITINFSVNDLSITLCGGSGWNYWRLGLQNADDAPTYRLTYKGQVNYMEDPLGSVDYSENLYPPNGDWYSVIIQCSPDGEYWDETSPYSFERRDPTWPVFDPPLFTVIDAPPPGPGGPQPTGGTAVVLENSPPKVALNDVLPNIIKGNVEIKYSAEDLDDKEGRTEWGLTSTSVNIFLVSEPADSATSSPIVENLPPTSTYLWDTSKVPDGKNYRLKLVVTDKKDLKGIALSDTFEIDNTPPTFNLDIMPNFSKGEPFAINVLSSETIKDTPVITITQHRHRPVVIPLKPGVLPNSFEGSYKPIVGYDGTALVSLEGEDLAGNKNNVFVGPESLTVGLNPPEKPVITTPSENFRTDQPLLPVLEGQSPITGKVIIKLNGKVIGAPGNLKDGLFRMENIKLNPLFNRGRNIVSVVAEDSSGVQSEAENREIIANSPPKVSFTEPAGQLIRLNGIVNFRWDGNDPNDDKLVYDLELSADGGTSWKKLAANLKEEQFNWDSATVPDGFPYQLRLTASDGSLTGQTVSGQITVMNDLPAIILEESGDLFTSSTTKTIKGFVRSKNDLLQKLELSLDNGMNWKNIPSESGQWKSNFEKFTITLNKKTSLSQKIILRGTSATNKIIINAQNLKIGFDAVAPGLVTPKFPSLITNRSFAFTGIANDNLAGIRNVEYRFDGGDWLEAPFSGKIGSLKTEFIVGNFQPLKDGNHTIEIIAIDRANNLSAVKKFGFETNTTPPRTGSFTFENNAKIIFPNTDGLFELPADMPIHFRMALGGKPTKALLSIGTSSLPLKIADIKNVWEGDFTMKKTADTIITVTAENSVGNKTRKNIAKISVK
jgi:hypothetical protein